MTDAQLTAFENYMLPSQGMPMSEPSRTHLRHHIDLARRAANHNSCLTMLRYCEGYIGALTIELRCTMEEHQSTYRELNEIRERSHFLKATGRRV